MMVRLCSLRVRAMAIVVAAGLHATACADSRGGVNDEQDPFIIDGGDGWTIDEDTPPVGDAHDTPSDEDTAVEDTAVEDTAVEDTTVDDARDARDAAPDSVDDGSEVGDDAGLSGLPVGSACAAAEECSGPEPDCIVGAFHPLEALLESESTAAAGLAALAVIPFPGGYCSNVAPCTSDDDCGTDGACFRPLIDVSESAYAELVGALGLPSGGVEEATVLGFREYGQCLLACESDDECGRDGYGCNVPLEQFLALTEAIGGRLQTYCIGDPTNVCAEDPCVNGTCQAGPDLSEVCVCEEGYEGATCDTPIDCGDPGTVAPPLLLDLTEGTRLGATARYSCEAGYSLEGDSARSCEATGWSGAAPTCEEIVGPCDGNPCGEHGSCVEAEGGFFGCECDAGWSGDVCDARVDCGAIVAVDPQLSLEYTANALGEDTGLGAVATFACAPGFDLRGEPRSTTCLDSGAWSPAGQPTCGIVDCGPPAAAPPLQVDLDDGTSTFESAATYSCAEGFRLEGDAASICGAEGRWSGERACRPITCPRYIASNANLRVTNPDDTDYGDRVAFACDGDLEVSGGTSVQCVGGDGGEGVWQGAEPSCVEPAETCDEGSCSGNGTCYEDDGAFERCECDAGWTGPRCASVVTCGPAPETNGPHSTRTATTGTTYGAGATYECGTGYTGPTVTPTCGGAGTWSGPAAVCTPISCSAHPESALGAGVVRLDEGGSSYGTVARFGCNATSGHEFAPGSGSTQTCGADGNWSGTVSCVLHDCGTPATGTQASLVLGGGTLYGAHAIYRCLTGYRAVAGYSSPHEVACTIDGWAGTPDGAALDCGPVDCGAPAAPATNGRVEFAATTYTATATYACFEGYTLSGAASVTCGADGDWSADPPTCTPVDCGEPAAPTDGRVEYSRTTFGATATYACDAGLTPSGPTTATCLADHTWSNPPPECVRYVCDVVYRTSGTFQITDTPARGCGDQTSNIGANASNPSFSGSGTSTPFTPTAFPRGFMRLRFPSDGVNPVAGTVQLIEYYMPIEFSVSGCPGTTLQTNVDHSVGLLGMSGAPPSIPASPSVNRSCRSWGSGRASGTSLNWESCDVVPSGGVAWSHDDAQDRGTVTGCASRMSVWGNASCSGAPCFLVPGLGNQRATWTQLLRNLTFSGTNYRTATFTMPRVELPESTSETTTRTWLAITSATPIHVECNAIDLITCGEQ